MVVVVVCVGSGTLLLLVTNIRLLNACEKDSF